MLYIYFKFILSQQEREEHNQQAIAAYLKNARKDHQRILARRQTIEERKERLESLNIQREKEELEQREAEMQKVRKAEEERLRQEAKEREKERIMEEHKQIKKKNARERLEQIKKTELGAKAFKDIDIEVMKCSHNQLDLGKFHMDYIFNVDLTNWFCCRTWKNWTLTSSWLNRWSSWRRRRKNFRSV